jgi:predicted nucleic acid-binding protein
MRTAIDTNVLSALWSKESVASDIARNLGNAKTEGGLVVGAPVYAELLAYPKATASFVNGFSRIQELTSISSFNNPYGWRLAGVLHVMLSGGPLDRTP